jgi:hypothetical protein
MNSAFGRKLCVSRLALISSSSRHENLNQKRVRGKRIKKVWPAAGTFVRIPRMAENGLPFRVAAIPDKAAVLSAS